MGPLTLGTYVTGGNGTTGLAPANWPANLCGLSFSINAFTPAVALNGLDHRWLQSTTTPKVVDFGSPVNTVLVFVAVDHGPFPEEGIEQTVWGSNNPSIVGFPAGWTLATITRVWRDGWEQPPVCEPGDNADDFTGQYSFPGNGFQYVAVHANHSISIFLDPSHTTWTASDDNSGVPGWQSFDDEIDAVGTLVCDEGAVTADAGPDQVGGVGDQLCFDGSGSTAQSGPPSLGWDLDGDNAIDVAGTQACITCTEEGEGDVVLFATDECGCVDSDTAHFTCISCEPDPRTQGYWHRQCLGAGLITPGRGRGPQEVLEPDFLKTLVPAVDQALESLIWEFRTCEDGMDAEPPSDHCEQAIKQFTAMLLNIESGRLQGSCGVDLSVEGCSSTNISGLVNEIAALINSGDDDNCKVARDCAAAVNEGTAVTQSFGQGLVAPTQEGSTESPTTLVATPGPVKLEASTPTDEPAPAADAADVTQQSIAVVESPEVTGEVSERPEAEQGDPVRTVRRQMAVLSNPSAPDQARDVAREALLTALGGGFEVDLRLEVVAALLDNVDVAYRTLLEKHLVDIRDEAAELGQEAILKEAEGLLRQLEQDTE